MPEASASSGLTIDQVLTGADGMRQVVASNGSVYFLATKTKENSRGSVCRVVGSLVEDLTPEANVRTRINEYGGGAYDVDGNLLCYNDANTGSVMVQDLTTGDRRHITPPQSGWQFGGLALSAEAGIAVAVREEPGPDAGPIAKLVCLSLTESNADGGTVVAEGADFYSYPTLSGTKVAWVQWSHPNMPWDAATVWRADVSDPGSATEVTGGEDVSAIHPRWLSDGRLACLTDEAGFWNLWVDGRLYRDDHDYSLAPWVADRAPLAQLDDNTIVSVRYDAGAGELVGIQLDSGEGIIALSSADIESVSCDNGEAFAIASWADRPPTLVGWTPEATRELFGEPNSVSSTAPEPIWFDGPAGPTQAWLYPAASDGTKPPLLAMTHGGPTAMVSSAYDPVIQYWVAAGVSVLDVNYSGSAGFGREYRNRLRGNWGILDVADCVCVVDELIAARRVDPNRIAIAGSSAGGYTTLQALVMSDAFAAGISRYGIADLTALAAETHKFEAHYNDSLIGPLPEAAEAYQARSPINHLEELQAPMLILQGTDDPVVPLNQAEKLAQAVQRKGLPMAMVIFPGEGHGFRTGAARKGALEAQLSFLAQLFNLELSEPIPSLTITNL